MSRVMRDLNTVRHGATIALTDFRWFYSWRTWTGGWLVRMVCQVAFYSLIGVTVGGDDYVAFIVLGAALMVCVTETLMTVASTTWDQVSGTLPLLVSSPVEPVFFYLGRSIMWPASAVVTTSVAVFGVSAYLGIGWTLAGVGMTILLIVLVALTSYFIALTLGALALLVPGARNVISALATMLITCFCGAVVPVDYWPQVVAWVAQAVPVTHGLEAVRAVQAQASADAVGSAARTTAFVGLGWFVAASLMFRWVYARARRGGVLE